MRSRARWASILAVLAVAPAVRAGGCPACSNPNLPMGGSSLGDATQSTADERSRHEVAAAVAPTLQGLFVLALTADFLPTTSSHIEDCPDLGPRCAGAMKPTPYRHNVASYGYGATLDVQYGVLSWLSVSVTAPYRALTARVHYTDLADAPYTPDPPDIHHRNETISGLADPTVAVALGDAMGPLGFSVRLGALLPLGRTLDVDPFAAGRAGVAHEHVQFGTGTVRPIAGSALGYDFGAVGVDGFFQGTLAIASNAIGYRPGQRIAGGVRLSSALGTSSARFGLGAEAAHETTETWHGSVQEEGNLGRTDVLAVVGARWSPFARWGFFGALKTPVYAHAVGAQLSYPLVVQLGVATGWAL